MEVIMMHKECFLCDLKQMKKVSQFLSLCQDKEDELFKQTNAYLKCCDMTKTNPEIMARKAQNFWMF